MLERATHPYYGNGYYPCYFSYGPDVFRVSEDIISTQAMGLAVECGGHGGGTIGEHWIRPKGLSLRFLIA